MKKFKDLSEQHAEAGRFRPVKPYNVNNKALVTPRKENDSANVKLKEDADICKFCQHDPCICDDSHGFVSESKRMSAAVKLQRAFEREQAKSTAVRARGQSSNDKLKTQINQTETMDRLKQLKSEGYNDYHNNRTGFAKRQREDDEYHTPDPTTRTHEIVHTVSKDGGEKHNRKVTISNSSKTPQEAKSMARAHLEKQGYTIHEAARPTSQVEKARKLGKFHKKTGFTGKNPFKDHPSDVQQAYANAKKQTNEEVEVLDETKISKYKDLGATKQTTHFVKNTTTGEVLSPHRGRADAEEGLRAAEADGAPGHKFKIVRAVKEETMTNKKDKKSSDNDVPFDGPYTKKPSATPGKHGAGYSTARHLARQAMAKFAKPVKEESEYSRKAQIVKDAKKSKKTDNKFEPDPELGSSVVKADN